MTTHVALNRRIGPGPQGGGWAWTAPKSELGTVCTLAPVPADFPAACEVKPNDQSLARFKLSESVYRKPAPPLKTGRGGGQFVAMS